MFHTTHVESSFPATPPVIKDIRTLLLDDSNFDCARIRRLSTKTELPIHLDEVNSIAEMDKAVAETSYDVILIDYRLPVGDGMIALDHVLKNNLNKDAGKIMITGNVAVETAVQAMRGGCHDFLAKDQINAKMLREAILNAASAARQKQGLEFQAGQQREAIREWLVAALKDGEVQENVLSMLKQHIGSDPSAGKVWNDENLEVLLTGITEEDDFIFH